MFARLGCLMRSVSKPSTSGLVKLTPMDKLSKTLKEEMDLQKENYESTENMIIHLKSKGYHLSDSLNSYYVSLSKELSDNQKLVIGINTTPIYIPPGADSAEMAEDGTPTLKRLVNFDVSILNADLREAMSVKCITVDFKILPTCVVHVKNVPFDSPDYIFSKLSSYKGPNFESLSENIQETIQDYLIYLGFDEDLMICITLLAFDKQKRLSFLWMRNIIKLMSV